jgi:hypothetical protein
MKLSGLRARVLDISSIGGGYCIRTLPVPTMLDGEGAVRVDSDGVVRAVVLTDSAACPAATAADTRR